VTPVAGVVLQALAANVAGEQSGKEINVFTTVK
jgi:hypothetical protein